MLLFQLIVTPSKTALSNPCKQQGLEEQGEILGTEVIATAPINCASGYRIRHHAELHRALDIEPD